MSLRCKLIVIGLKFSLTGVIIVRFINSML